MEHAEARKSLLKKRSEAIAKIEELQKTLQAYDYVLRDYANEHFVAVTPAAAAPSPAPAPSGASTESSHPHMRDHLPAAKRYGKNMTWEEKCLFVLNEIKMGFSKDIANIIVKYEPDMDFSFVLRNVRAILSKMFNTGKIRAHLVGKKNKYFI